MQTNFLVAKIKKYKIEDVFFYFMLIYSLCLVWKYDFYMTMDGPSHLYNSSLLNYYDKSEFLQHYFQKNNLTVLPNYTDHFILQYFLKFFNVLFAHKLFISLIIFFLPITFRYSVKLISNKAGNYYFIIFPLLFNSLLHLGFFNFIMAFIFFNLQIIITIFIIKRNKWFYLFLFLFAINLVILFYTHAFIFGISLFVSFCLIIFKHFNDLKRLLIDGFLLFLVSLPSLLFFYFFNKTFHITSYDYDSSDYEKFKDVMFFSPAIVYTIFTEAPYSSLITILCIVLITFIIIKKSELNTWRDIFKLADVFFILSFCILLILFYSKNGMLSGMFSVRLTLLFYYFLFFWIAANSIKNNIITFLSVFLILVSFINLAEIRHSPLSGGAIDVNEALLTAQHIKNKSIVYPINLIELNSNYAHFSNFVGVNREVVIAENYEAELGWFPLKWKTGIKPIRCELHNNSIQIPDYVYIYGNFSLLDKVENATIKKFIDSACTNTYNSNDGLTKLFIVNKEKVL